MSNNFKLSVCAIISYFILNSCEKKVKTQESYQMADGFNCDLVASEPLVFDPVDIEFNEKGEAYVLEMPGYPFEKEMSRIINLIDSDDDGVYDKRQVFAENLNLASSIFPYKKGFLVAAPPYLLHVQDLDGNQKAEKTDTLMAGFSTGNLQHNYNGLQFGLDGWLYAANGGNSGAPYFWPNANEKIELHGKDFRINIQEKIIEKLGESAGGFGITFDEYGRMYGTHNMEHVSQLVYHETYNQGKNILEKHNLANISDHEEAGTARVYPIGEQESRVNHPEQSGYFSGGCGICYYGGAAFGDKYNNSIWINDVVLNLVHVDQLADNGAAQKASRIIKNQEIWANSDRASRPVNMTVGPDGAIYLVDMYRKVIEHPEWIPDDLEAEMDLNAGKEKGRIYRISNDKNDFTKIDLSDLTSSLSHPNQWVRNTAQRIISENKLADNDVVKLKKILVGPSDLGRLHAMWLLGNQDKLAENELNQLLADKNSGIRENALKLAEKFMASDKMVEKVISSLNDDNQRVRLQAALCLSKVPVNKWPTFTEPFVDAVASSSKKPMDKWNVAALTVASAPLILEVLQALTPSTPENLLNSLAANVPGDKVESFLAFLQSFKADHKIIAQMIEHQTNSATPLALSDISKNLLVELEKNKNPAIIKAINSFRNKNGLPPSKYFVELSKKALDLVADQKLSENERLQQLSMIESLPFAQKQNVLFNCLHNVEPLNIQMAALKQLYSHNTEPIIGKKLLEIWPNLGPMARKSAGDILLYTEQYNHILLTGLEQNKINIGEMNFDLERRRQLLWWNKNKSINKRAEALFKDSGVVTRKQALQKMQVALSLTGNLKNGTQVFVNNCSSCHQFGGVGHEVGPNLTEISRKSKGTNLHDIVDPNAAVDTKYISHQIDIKGGKTVVGIINQENDSFIELKQMGAITEKIAKKDITKMKSLGKSYMIEGLEASMSPQEMADLLTYLQNEKH